MEIRKKLTSPIVWGNLLAMVIVAFILCMLVWKGMDEYTHHGESIEVPSLIGMQENDAYYKLSVLGLHGVVVDSSYNKNLPAGSILEQTPTQGRKVKSGRQIFLTINTERTPTMALPDIADNSSLREAQAKLTAMGFKLAPVEYVEGDREWVYGVKSRGVNVYTGERVPIDVPLVLQVGKGTNDLEEVEEEESIEDGNIAEDAQQTENGAE